MFSPGSKIYSFCQKIYELIIVNIMVIIFSMTLILFGVGILVGIKKFKSPGEKISSLLRQIDKNQFSHCLYFILLHIISYNSVQFIRNIPMPNFLIWIYYIFLIFLGMMNINCYIVLDATPKAKILNVIRLSYMLTIFSFPKTLLITIGFSTLVFITIKYLGFIYLFTFLSLPLLLLTKVQNKEIEYIQRINKYN